MKKNNRTSWCVSAISPMSMKSKNANSQVLCPHRTRISKFTESKFSNCFCWFSLSSCSQQRIFLRNSLSLEKKSCWMQFHVMLHITYVDCRYNICSKYKKHTRCMCRAIRYTFDISFFLLLVFTLSSNTQKTLYLYATCDYYYI